MIVADTNLIAWFILPSPSAPEAEAVFAKDPTWTAPALWRYEFKNVLTTQIRLAGLPLEKAAAFFEKAEELILRPEIEVASAGILRLAAAKKLSAYDAEFLGLAMALGIKLVTADRGILKAAPREAISPKTFANS
jgi:predicted nucleic acid-binding protein